jgi:hypothetical protein
MLADKLVALIVLKGLTPMSERGGEVLQQCTDRTHFGLLWYTVSGHNLSF